LKKPDQPSLFDVIERDEMREHPERCIHRTEQKTDTDWGPPYGVRMTLTCDACGRIRGRCC